MNRPSYRRTLLVDLAIAAVLVVVILIVAPGLAVVGLLALLVLIVGGISLVIELRGHARRARTPDLREPQ